MDKYCFYCHKKIGAIFGHAYKLRTIIINREPRDLFECGTCRKANEGQRQQATSRAQGIRSAKRPDAQQPHVAQATGETLRRLVKAELQKREQQWQRYCRRIPKELAKANRSLVLEQLGDWGYLGSMADTRIEQLAAVTKIEGLDAMWVPDVIQFITRRTQGISLQDKGEINTCIEILVKLVYHALKIEGSETINGVHINTDTGVVPILSTITSLHSTIASCMNIWDLTRRSPTVGQSLGRQCREIRQAYQLGEGDHLMSEVALYLGKFNAPAIVSEGWVGSANLTQFGLGIAAVCGSAAAAAASSCLGPLIPIITKLSMDIAQSLDREKLWEIDKVRGQLKTYCNSRALIKIIPTDYFDTTFKTLQSSGKLTTGISLQEQANEAAFHAMTGQPPELIMYSSFDIEEEKISRLGAEQAVYEEFKLDTDAQRELIPIFMIASKLEGSRPFGYSSFMRATIALLVVRIFATHLQLLEHISKIIDDAHFFENVQSHKSDIRNIYDAFSKNMLLVTFADTIAKRYFADEGLKCVLSRLIVAASKKGGMYTDISCDSGVWQVSSSEENGRIGGGLTVRFLYKHLNELFTLAQAIPK